MSHHLSKLTDFAFPGIVVVALSVIGYYSTRPPLTSARPAPASTAFTADAPLAPPGMAAMHARIWDDPLLPYNDHPSDVDNARGTDPGIAARVLQQSVSTAEQFTCLAVLVPGGPDAESHEQRLRTRYAVVSALTQGGYRLKYNSRLPYVDLPDIKVVLPAAVSGLATPPITVRVPLKLYVKDIHPGNGTSPPTNDSGPAQHRVLVCWIDELALGERPLSALQQVMAKLFPECETRSNVKLRIIGPTSSDMLETMSRSSSEEENISWGEWGNGKPQLWSYRATRANLGNKEQFLERTGVEFHRVIGSDRDLQDALRWELSLRNAWPKPGTKEKIVLLTEIDTSYGRGWTHEGRPFQEPDSDSKSSSEAVQELRVMTSRRGPVKVSVPPYLTSDQVLVFSYLRGIDGRTMHPSSRQANRGKKSQDDSQSTRQAGSDKVEPQTGPAQVDYLRRLEQELTLLHDANSIKAIGIIGTDVYDKLLILRALRPHFPNAVFFTTDLDVELWHPAELAWTRNLVVASHFGLVLNPTGLESPTTDDDSRGELGGSASGESHQALESVPSTVNHPTPFRDSYQTAAFFAVRQALASTASNGQPVVPEGNTEPSESSASVTQVANTSQSTPVEPGSGCLLFEIGSHGPFHLATINATRGLHPPTSHTHMSLIKTLAVVATVLVLLAVPYWAGIRFVVDLVELFKRAWQTPRGRLGQSSRFAEGVLSSASRLIHGRPFRRFRYAVAAIAFLSACGALLILMFDWSVTLLILLGVGAVILFVFGAWPTTRWDIYFFAFAGVVILTLLLRRFSVGETGTTWSWITGFSVAGVLTVGMVTSKPLRMGLFLFGRHLHAAVRANVVGRQPRELSRTRHDFRDSDAITPYWIIVLATVVAAATVAAVIVDQFSVAGEPFTAAGISMWPVTLARAGLFLLACIFIVICISSLAQNAAKLERMCFGQNVPPTALPPVWRQFFDRRFLKSSAHPAMPMVWAFFAGSYLFFTLTSFPSNPSRGTLCFVTSQAVMNCTVIAMALLSFVVYEAVQSVRACVKRLKRQLDDDGSTCPDQMLVNEARQWHVALRGELRPVIEGLTIVKLLAERTRTVGRLLLLPAWIVLGVALIRLSWLDHLGVSWQLLLVLGILVFFPVTFYARLRLEVHRVRDQINGKLERLKSALTANGDNDELRQLAILHDAINNESRGAFAPISRDPIFQALSIPFGGAGSVMIIQDIMSSL